MSEILERVEFLALTVLPITYAQLARLTTVIFLTGALVIPTGGVLPHPISMCCPCPLSLAAVPVAASAALDWGTIALSFIANIIYFSIDEVAAQMEMR